MPPRRSRSHASGFQGSDRAYADDAPSKDSRGFLRARDDTEESRPRRREYGGKKSLRFDLAKNSLRESAGGSGDGDDDATGRRTEDLGSVDNILHNVSESPRRSRMPKSRSSYFAGGDAVSVREATRDDSRADPRSSGAPSSLSSRGRRGDMPKSRSLHDMRESRPSSAAGDVEGRASETDVFEAFDPAAVKRAKEFIRAVRSGKLQKVGDLLAADFAHSMTAGKAGGEASVSSVIARAGTKSRLANAVDPASGDSAIHIACEGHNYELVTRLLGHGARLTTKGAHGDTALHRAVRDRKNTQLIRTMFQHSCEPDVPNDRGTCPMHIAAERGNLDIVEVLVDNGASLNRQDADGNTPLHVAAKNQKSKATALLLSKGCDATIRNRAGLTAYQLCRKGKVKIAFSAFGLDR